MIALALANVNSMDEAIAKLGLLSKDRLSLGQ